MLSIALSISFPVHYVTNTLQAKRVKRVSIVSLFPISRKDKN